MSVQKVSPEKAVEVLTIELESKQDKIAELKAQRDNLANLLKQGAALVDEYASENTRLTATNESERRLADMAWNDNQAALKQISAAIEDIKIYCISCSCWSPYCPTRPFKSRECMCPSSSSILYSSKS